MTDGIAYGFLSDAEKMLRLDLVVDVNVTCGDKTAWNAGDALRTPGKGSYGRLDCVGGCFQWAQSPGDPMGFIDCFLQERGKGFDIVGRGRLPSIQSQRQGFAPQQGTRNLLADPIVYFKTETPFLLIGNTGELLFKFSAFVDLLSQGSMRPGQFANFAFNLVHRMVLICQCLTEESIKQFQKDHQRQQHGRQSSALHEHEAKGFRGRLSADCQAFGPDRE